MRDKKRSVHRQNSNGNQQRIVENEINRKIDNVNKMCKAPLLGSAGVTIEKQKEKKMYIINKQKKNKKNKNNNN